ncbi:MAG TPA: copper amine oxidase N-terminal domain-containing protein [Sedimentibacter sp.]|nr:copper amine oxidase N-terminal domain-containing protein [Sedimentibacter sp.]HOW23915.1 copper amine oxidase N-terminal domain-containing protein [Sedimentibacter sp.]
MKKIVFVLSLVLILILSSVTAFADEIVITIDSAKVEFNDDAGFPFIDENNRTQVPFRATLEKFGAKVEWNDESKTAIATKGETVVEVPIGQNYILKDGEEITVDTAARIVNGRTYLPIRPVIEAFGSQVEWDAALNTVVITTEPVDARAIYFAASEKSNAWDNYDMDAKIKMSMNVPDAQGNMQPFNMDMNMYMTLFMNPIKAKINLSMTMPGMENMPVQPIMNMYMTVDEEAITQYIGMADETGELKWIKQTIKIDEKLSGLMKNDQEAMQNNKELVEKYTKDVKYFGKYVQDGKTLLRLQYILSGDIYKEMFADFSEVMPEPASEEEAMAYEMIQNIGNIDIGDLSYIIYVDEATGEMVKMEIDLGDAVSSMASGMIEAMGMPPETVEVLKSLKADMSVEFLNINSAKDFEIPKEALEAQDIYEMMQEMQDTQIEFELEEDL